MIDRLYINYIKRDFDFENLDFADKQNLTTIFEHCAISIAAESILPIEKLNRFYFMRDMIADIYFSNNRHLLSRVNYSVLCAIEEKCAQHTEEIENFWSYYQASLINKLCEVN